MSEGPMDVRAKQTIWKQFQDLLPRSLGPDQLRILLDKIRDEHAMLGVVYEAAVFAGWCRGYAEGDGAHRLSADQRKDPWRWMRHGDNDLESMSTGMTIMITAGELRELIEAQVAKDTGRARCQDCNADIPRGQGFGWSATDEEWTDKSKGRPIVHVDPLCNSCIGNRLTKDNP